MAWSSVMIGVCPGMSAYSTSTAAAALSAAVWLAAATRAISCPTYSTLLSSAAWAGGAGGGVEWGHDSSSSSSRRAGRKVGHKHRHQVAAAVSACASLVCVQLWALCCSHATSMLVLTKIRIGSAHTMLAR